MMLQDTPVRVPVLNKDGVLCTCVFFVRFTATRRKTHSKAYFSLKTMGGYVLIRRMFEQAPEYTGINFLLNLSRLITPLCRRTKHALP